MPMAGLLSQSLLWAFFLPLVLSDLLLYPNDTLTTSTTVTLSQLCVAAMEASLSCDPYLQLLANQDYYGSMEDSSLQTSLCNPACGSALSSYHASVTSACRSDPQPWQGLPAEWYGDMLWAAYNQTCLKDKTSDFYCNGGLAFQTLFSRKSPAKSRKTTSATLLLSWRGIWNSQTYRKISYARHAW